MSRTRIIGGIVLALTAMLPAPAASAQTITEFPTSDSGPVDITAGPDGNVWFTGYLAGTIGRITPAGTVTEFLNDPNNGPAGITVGPDGNLWYADEYANEIGRVTTSGAVTSFPGRRRQHLPGGHRGRLGRQPLVRRVRAATRTGEFRVDGRQDRTDHDLGNGHRSSRCLPSFRSSGHPGRPGRQPLVHRSRHEHDRPHDDVRRPDEFHRSDGGRGAGRAHGRARRRPLVHGSDGAQDRPDHDRRRVHRVSRFRRRTSRRSGSSKGPDGNLWFTDNSNNSIGRMTTSGAVTMFPIPTAGSGPVRSARVPTATSGSPRSTRTRSARSPSPGEAARRTRRPSAPTAAASRCRPSTRPPPGRARRARPTPLRDRARASGRPDVRHGILLVLLSQQRRDRHQGRGRPARQQQVLGVRGGTDRRQRRHHGDRHADRGRQDLHEPAGSRLPADPGHERFPRSAPEVESRVRTSEGPGPRTVRRRRRPARRTGRRCA